MMRFKRANVCWPMVFDGGFRFREADAETDGKCHRGQAHRARQEPDALRVERDIRVFPALAQTYTKKDKGYGLDACLASLWDLWRGATAERSKSHSLAFDRPRKIWKTWSKAERLSSLKRKKRAVLNTSAEPIPCLRKAFMTD